MSATAASFCADLIRQHDRDRYITSLFAPADVRPALQAVYAFNLEVARTREAVSEPMLGEIRLQWWREAIDEMFAGTPRRHEVVTALAAAVGGRPALRGHLDAIIDARAADLYDTRFPTLAELEAYAEATSANVIRLALQVLDRATAPDLAEAARHAGIAYALAGLIHALPFHARHNRLFLPDELLDRHGLKPDDVLALRAPQRLRPPLAELAARAEEHLTAARGAAGHVPARALPALLPASLAGTRLKRLRRRGYDVWRGSEHRPGAGAIAALALRAWSGRF